MSFITSESSQRKVWFITGASSGLGYWLTLEILSRGDYAIATARKLSSLEDLKRKGAYVMEMDVTDDIGIIQRKAEEALKVYGRVDVLVNNAGYGVFGALEEVGIKGYIDQYRTNVFGVINVTHAFLPHMRRRRSGSIVIIGSRSAWTAKAAARIAAQRLQCMVRLSNPNHHLQRITNPFSHPILPFQHPHITIPSQQKAIAESLIEELKPFNIRVLLVQPGGFRTRMILNSTIKPANSLINPDYQKFHTIAAKVLAGVHDRQPGDPKKAGRVIVDIVRGEGRAFGRKWPDTIVLGSDAVKDVRRKCEAVIACLDDEEWCDVSKDVAF